jgi:hypothetical protein
MERAEAEAFLDGDRETAVALLMRLDELVKANRRLEARVGELEQRLSRCPTRLRAGWPRGWRPGCSRDERRPGWAVAGSHRG